jgi:hypothetical protein
LSRQDPQAPLFYSAADDFQDENESDEHEREVADFYALQRSRQHFGRSNLTESSEIEDTATAKADSQHLTEGQQHDRQWEGSRLGGKQNSSSPKSNASSTGQGMVDVNLHSVVGDDEPPASLANLSPSIDPDEAPAPFQTFRTSKTPRSSHFLPMETDEDTQMAHPRPPSPDRESAPATVILPSIEQPLHDGFWGNVFLISEAAMFAAFVLIWFHTSTPKSSSPIGDTVYSALRGSMSMLLWDTLIAIVVALLWLSLLRNYVRVLVFGILVAVPVILGAFSLYPFISSFQGAYNGDSYQDRAMRWFSFVPALMAAFWTWSVIQNRHNLNRSINILEFSTKILAASPYLVVLGFATLGVVVVFSWIWLLMFERIFLSGHLTTSGATRFIIDANSWWLGAYFILQYLWTLGVISGVQRATTAAAVSQWYFHRFVSPQPTSREVVRASFQHATTALFGTVCLSTFLSLLVRLPLIILPGRLSGLLNMCAYWIMPASLAVLTNPLTLTYAAIHSQGLGIAARGLSQLSFVSKSNPSNTLGARNFRVSPGGPDPANALLPYRLAKLLLQATRWIMSLALGFGGWVRAARNIAYEGAVPGIRGSLYAYVVGLLAGTIGYAVLGAVENVVGAVVDAAVICWASESAGGQGEARFCREAGELFGQDDAFNGRGEQRDEEDGDDYALRR